MLVFEADEKFHFRRMSDEKNILDKDKIDNRYKRNYSKATVLGTNLFRVRSTLKVYNTQRNADKSWHPEWTFFTSILFDFYTL